MDDLDTAWMRDDLTKACQRLGINTDQSEFIAGEFAHWAADRLTRRVTSEIQDEQRHAA